MRNLDHSTSLAALSIPGTHNSPTHYRALPSVRCQAVSIGEQLENGIRFLDVRVQPRANIADETLHLVHGAFPISLTGPKTFRTLVNEVKNFLAANSSETVILSIKREGVGSATDQQLSLILRDHYISPDHEHWYTEPTVPRLGEVRGKVIVLRRFALDEELQRENDGRGWCLNAENWPYNKPYCQYGDVSVQDYCELASAEEIDLKIKYCCDHVERAAASMCITTPVQRELVFLNYLSAANFWKPACWPEAIAAKVNPALVIYLSRRQRAQGQATGGIGIIICDWIGKDGDWRLVRSVIEMNGRFLRGNQQ